MVMWSGNGVAVRCDTLCGVLVFGNLLWCCKLMWCGVIQHDTLWCVRVRQSVVVQVKCDTLMWCDTVV